MNSERARYYEQTADTLQLLAYDAAAKNDREAANRLIKRSDEYMMAALTMRGLANHGLRG